MSGQQVSVVVDYSVDVHCRVTVERRVYWPTLRAVRSNVRGYLRHFFDDQSLPQIFDGESLRSLVLAPLGVITFDGVLTLNHLPYNGLQVRRQFFPSLSKRVVIEHFLLTNAGVTPLNLSIIPPSQPETKSPFIVHIAIDPLTDVVLAPGGSTTFAVMFLAAEPNGLPEEMDPHVEAFRRRQWLDGLSSKLQLETPDAVIDRMFALAKIRSADSVFMTRMGLVHSPGGERYYGGIWANDEAEYAGPFFPFLGDESATTATLNAYRVFASRMNPDFKRLPYAFEVEGDRPMDHVDRGDAAMIAYGASRFALAHGDPAIGAQLWPLVEWCLQYCRRQLNTDGVVASATDELEGRFPTGEANLSTSTLYYGGLIAATALAAAIGLPMELGDDLLARAKTLRDAIEAHFGASVGGFETYQYFDGYETLRAWICLPLTMGIFDRAAGTVAALFSPRLWTADGVATQEGDTTFWDRATLYALRGVLMAGATETGMRHLHAFSRRRLLGDHVPYAIEAYPEGNQAHLSAESALYCRVIIEGLFGITPTGFSSFTLSPRLPAGWPSMALLDVQAFQCVFDIRIHRKGDENVLRIIVNGETVLAQVARPDEIVRVELRAYAAAAL